MDAHVYAGGSVHYRLPMDVVLPGNLIANPSGLDARLSGHVTFVMGPRNRGLLVDGRDSFIRVSGPGHRHECFGDLTRCPNGRRLKQLTAVILKETSL